MLFQSLKKKSSNDMPDNVQFYTKTIKIGFETIVVSSTKEYYQVHFKLWNVLPAMFFWSQLLKK